MMNKKENAEVNMEETRSVQDNQITLSIGELEKLVSEMVAREREKEEENLKLTVDAQNELMKEKLEYMAERVPIKLFKDRSNYKDDMVVAVNGTCYQIKRGVEVMVPRYVAAVIANSQNQEVVASEYMDSLADQYARETAALG